MGHIYASSDWHGCLNPAVQLLNSLADDDTLYYLGDAIDRGEHGIEIMDLLLNDPRVIYLKGNHENFMEEYAKDRYKDEIEYMEFCGMGDLWVHSNGGQVTWDYLIKNRTKEQIWDYVYRISAMPQYIKLETEKGIIHLSHAGFTINAFRDRLHGPDYLWDRDHLRDLWQGEENEYIIHGHTPVQYFNYFTVYDYNTFLGKDGHSTVYTKPEIKNPIEIVTYCEGHKIDIDLGTIESGRVALLNLDNFEVKYFGSDGEQ